jgi:hypothetical protein
MRCVCRALHLASRWCRARLVEVRARTRRRRVRRARRALATAEAAGRPERRATATHAHASSRGKARTAMSATSGGARLELIHPERGGNRGEGSERASAASAYHLCRSSSILSLLSILLYMCTGRLQRVYRRLEAVDLHRGVGRRRRRREASRVCADSIHSLRHKQSSMHTSRQQMRSDDGKEHAGGHGDERAMLIEPRPRFDLCSFSRH